MVENCLEARREALCRALNGAQRVELLVELLAELRVELWLKLAEAPGGKFGKDRKGPIALSALHHQAMFGEAGRKEQLKMPQTNDDLELPLRYSKRESID